MVISALVHSLGGDVPGWPDINTANRKEACKRGALINIFLKKQNEVMSVLVDVALAAAASLDMTIMTLVSVVQSTELFYYSDKIQYMTKQNSQHHQTIVQ